MILNNIIVLTMNKKRLKNTQGNIPFLISFMALQKYYRQRTDSL